MSLYHIGHISPLGHVSLWYIIFCIVLYFEIEYRFLQLLEIQFYFIHVVSWGSFYCQFVCSVLLLIVCMYVLYYYYNCIYVCSVLLLWLYICMFCITTGMYICMFLYYYWDVYMYFCITTGMYICMFCITTPLIINQRLVSVWCIF